MNKIYGLIILMMFSCSVSAASQCEAKKGINLAGPEFGGKIPGRIYWDYTFPSEKHIIYFKNVGFNYVRLPIKWNRIQPDLFGELDQNYLNEIKRFLNLAGKHHVSVLLDLHNYGRYLKLIDGKYKSFVVGEGPVTYGAFQDLWYKIALELESYDALYGYGLMNEPHHTNGKWFKAAQYGVDGIRQADRHSMIMVAGEGWSNAHRWSRVNPELPFVSDPENKIVYEAHVYFDKDYSGRYLDKDYIYPAKDVFKRLASFTDWLEKNGQKGVIGEWGIPSDSELWLGVADEFYKLADKYCLDSYYWNAGPWTERYILSLDPNIKKSDIKILTKHLKEKFNQNSDY